MAIQITKKKQLLKFIHTVNTYGLLDNLGLAKELCEITNERVKEHAPFFVVGVYVYNKS